MLTIATICARGGSVGVPDKNIRPLIGKPLIVHTIEQALSVPGIDRVFVSTDAQDIADVARAAGAEVPFLRPDHLATNDAPKLAALKHLIDWIEEEHGPVGTIVDLDPTSPLRNLDDITACMGLLDEGTDVVITGYEADKNPYFNMVEEKPDGRIGLVKSPEGRIVARQQAPKVYSMNASIYVWRRARLDKGLWQGNSRLHVMSRERSVDIDEPLDFDIVELLMQRRAAGGGCVKRLFDIVVSGLLVLIFAPVMIAVAIAVRAEAPGPVIYRQTRVGRDLRHFSIMKFRSMVADADQIGGHSTTPGDARVTRVGRFIRRTSLDELPQLFNVLGGDMSLVGPRPDVPAQESLYTPEDWIKRHRVRPGITGLAQATVRSAARPEERTRLDLEYVETSSLRGDLVILAMTARQVLMRGSY